MDAAPHCRAALDGRVQVGEPGWPPGGPGRTWLYSKGSRDPRSPARSWSRPSATAFFPPRQPTAEPKALVSSRRAKGS